MKHVLLLLHSVQLLTTLKVASNLKDHPLDFIISLVTEQNAGGLESAANRAGHDAVKSMVSSIKKRYQEKPDLEAKKAEAAPLAQVDAKLDHLKEELFSTTWSKVGYDIGTELDSTAVNVLMLIFSGGVGNAFTKLGAVLGELGGALGNAGKLVAVSRSRDHIR